MFMPPGGLHKPGVMPLGLPPGGGITPAMYGQLLLQWQHSMLPAYAGQFLSTPPHVHPHHRGENFICDFL